MKDIDFAARLVVVRDGKGAKDRRTMMPESLMDALRAKIEQVRRLHRRDLASGHGAVWLPHALETKYAGASQEFAWQWIFAFAASRLSLDPRSGVTRRHHLDVKVIEGGSGLQI